MSLTSLLNRFIVTVKPPMPPAPPAVPVGIFNVRDYGARGTGTGDDAPAIQKAIDTVQRVGSGTIYFPAGDYRVGKTLSIIEGKGINFLGDGQDNTMLRAGGCAVLDANGLWRSTFEQLSFRALGPGAMAVVDIDGNFDGQHTMGVQGNLFRSCYFDAAGQAPYAFAMCRQGGGSGQGSENMFLGCNFDGGQEACYFQNGQNALNNTIIGGNFQSFAKNGIEIVGGNINVISVGFQSTSGWQQVLNDGWDIDCSDVTTNNEVLVMGCRSESWRHFISGFGCHAYVRGIRCTPAMLMPWSPNTPIVAGTMMVGTTPLGSDLVYLATTAGTTGASAPVWSQGGQTQDGSVVWTCQRFASIHVDKGTVSEVELASPQFLQMSNHAGAVKVRSNYCASLMDQTIMIDASACDIAVSLPMCMGARYLVMRTDTSANRVTVQGGGNGFAAGEQTLLPGQYLDAVYHDDSGHYLVCGRG